MKSQRPKTSLSPTHGRKDNVRTPSSSMRKKATFDANAVGLMSPHTSTKGIKRPQTSNNLATKKWRAAHFHSGAPASRREVELLGEWLNSVLADNLENHDNPLDIVTNAQHWFSVAFNELIRQVSVTCAERGRLFACIWKRNQDLFQKLIEVQRDEREYILSCHKDRVQFLKTDLEFCNSRLATIEESYNEEQQRWKDNHEKDISKFDSLQQKIDQQIRDRKQLQQEIMSLEKQLGIESKQTSSENESSEMVFSFTYNELISRLQKMKSEIRNGQKLELGDIIYSLDDVCHYLEFTGQESFNIRSRFENLFLSLPSDHKPNIRDRAWVDDALSFVYATYIVSLSQSEQISSTKIDFALFLHQTFLHIFGNREQAEKTLFDLLCSSKQLSDEGNLKVTLFLRFLGYNDPLPTFALQYYVYCLVVMSKLGSSCLFPEVESNEEMIGGISVTVSSQAAQTIISRFATGRMQKFYTERIEKISNSGFLRFGGRAIAELDSVLEYLLTAYLEEEHKIEEAVLDAVKKLSSQQIWNFSELVTIAPALKMKLTHQVYSEIMVKCLTEKNGFPIKQEHLMKHLVELGLTIPFEFTRDDFVFEPSSEDIFPFVTNEYQYHQAEYEELLNRLIQNGDEIQVKQLKASKVKFDQNMSGRNSFKVFENNVREFFEKLNLFQFL
ncbi:hypothetical protein TRFO_36979 [Tritrichomonas foetus]|uniref:Uncharacterized protein n=1 Tax=Tritrichomonas foetus TaxID=1144522 RepID=A0A1J4JH24_9EUKA|nr:hypothetical protein TRFO_36979 [Tritrichomonas foetus]|eukprot:OHS96789.1 hypothetical protein TRFO_36979 [Tritrichomonas foetus]